MIFGIKIVGNKSIKDLDVKYTEFNKGYFCAFLRFDVENTTGFIQAFPYKKEAFVDAMIDYEIIDVNGIEVKHEKSEYVDAYHWDKGEHSYYMGVPNLLREDLHNIVDGISIEISDENTVKECLKLREYN